MNYKDYIDQIYNYLKIKWDLFTESPTYNQIMDRYENMTPSMQKLTLLGLAGLGALTVLAVPLSNLSDSVSSVTEFEEKRELIRDLLKASREASEVPDLPKAPSDDMLKAQIEGKLKNDGIFQEQIKSIESLAVKSALIPSGLVQGGVVVHLAKLNFRQMVDIGYYLSNLSQSVKLKDISITPNAGQNQYMDVVYKLVALAVPDKVGGDYMGDSAGGNSGATGTNKIKKGNSNPTDNAKEEDEE